MGHNLTVLCLVTAATLAGAGCVRAQTPAGQALVIPVRTLQAHPGDPATLELTLRAPAGTVLEVKTVEGELIGYVSRYGVEDVSTYTLALPSRLRGQPVRDVIVRSAEGPSDNVQVQGATVRIPAGD